MHATSTPAGPIPICWRGFRGADLLDPAGGRWRAARPDMVDRQLDRLLPGAGVIDMGTFMRALAATGTRAPAGIEMFSARLTPSLPTRRRKPVPPRARPPPSDGA